jgi:hypothetical protein
MNVLLPDNKYRSHFSSTGNNCESFEDKGYLYLIRVGVERLANVNRLNSKIFNS